MNDDQTKINNYKKQTRDTQPPLSRDEVEQAIRKRMGIVNNELLAGLELIKDYPKSVTFFGSSRFPSDNKYYKIALELSGRIAKDLNYAVVSGGGPGIMEAANKGAFESGGVSLGVIIKLPQQDNNHYLTKFREFTFFFDRKVVLSFSAETYVFFPGGFGTLDELFELVTLVQTRKIPKVPIILVGSEYWNKLHEFIKETLFKDYSAIDEEDMKIYRIIDSIDEIIEIIKNAPLRKE